MSESLFHPDFKVRPFWWEAFEPPRIAPVDLPKVCRVVIIGAGYTGLSAAIELQRTGHDCVVLDANQPGFGGSTRNGGMVSGGVNVGKRYLGKPLGPEDAIPALNDAADAFAHIENLIARENIECGWHRAGYFVGAWARSHYAAMAKKIESLNRYAQSEAYLVPEHQQRDEIGSDFYRGGMVIGRAGHLHPALYFKALFELAQKSGAFIAAETPVTGMVETGSGWRVSTPRGDILASDVVIATNGYTGHATPEFKRRVVPLASYIIATEKLDADMARKISPRNRSIADTCRVLTYYRLSPEGDRLIFGGRASFSDVTPKDTARILHRLMIERFPFLSDVRITHSWTGNVAFTLDEMPHMGKLKGLHYALGCNGSGVAMMSYLGHETARKIAGSLNRTNAFDRDEFPTHPLYRGNPWFVPVLGNWLKVRDYWDRWRDR